MSASTIYNTQALRGVRRRRCSRGPPFGIGQLFRYQGAWARARRIRRASLLIRVVTVSCSVRPASSEDSWRSQLRLRMRAGPSYELSDSNRRVVEDGDGGGPPIDGYGKDSGPKSGTADLGLGSPAVVRDPHLADGDERARGSVLQPPHLDQGRSFRPRSRRHRVDLPSRRGICPSSSPLGQYVMIRAPCVRPSLSPSLGGER